MRRQSGSGKALKIIQAIFAMPPCKAPRFCLHRGAGIAGAGLGFCGRALHSLGLTGRKFYQKRMALVALIIASERVDGDEGQLRAALPVAGVPLLERQAERAIGAGASRIFILVSNLPQPVMAVIDRINARGAEALAVRTLGEVVARMAPEDRLLLVGDALHAAPGQYRAVAGAAAPSLLVAPDNQTSIGFERIDAGARWAGLAILPYGLLSAHMDMPQDWETGSALVRAAVQSGARRIACDPGLFERGEIALVGDAAQAAAIESRLLQNVDFAGDGMGQSLLFAPFARLVGPALLRQQLSTSVVMGGAMLLLLACLILTGLDMPLAGALTGIAGAMTAALARFQMTLKRSARTENRLSQLFDALLMALPLVAAGAALVPWNGFSFSAAMIGAAALSLSGMVLLSGLLGRVSTEEDGQHSRALLPDGEIFLIISAIAAALGAPLFALPVTLLVAISALLWWVKRLVGRG